ncbi:MAG: NAD-dependent epimerase/dehydratase family protein [Firmicutes bacterium]|nr:NAD-dependent epimerase/dehydratase family protein [Bacillota bacterium]
MEHNVKKVFVAGGTGFLGYYSCLQFLERNILVDTIALPNEIDLEGWFPKSIGLNFGNMFEMSREDLVKLFSKKDYDTFVYALGPDDRFVPMKPAYTFFHEKLVIQAKKICQAAKDAKIKRCIIMNSYFSHFDRVYHGKLSKNHPYIMARRQQEQELIALGEPNVFDVMILELPYIFGTMPSRKPLWREFFLSYFEKYKTIYFPWGGGTTVIDVKDVAKAVVAAAFNGHHGGIYLIGDKNLTFKELISLMIEASSSKKRYRSVPPIIAAFGAKKIDKLSYLQGKESGLNHFKLMLQIQNKKFYCNPMQYKKELGYDELHFKEENDVINSIMETIKACYE